MSPHRLLQQEFSLGNFLNSIQIGILFIDKNYRIESPNTACSEIFNYSKEELTAISFIDLLPEKGRASFLENFTKIEKSKINKDSEVVEIDVLNKQGKRIAVELNINSTLTQSDQLYIVIVNDISKRKKLEKEIEVQIEDKEEIKEELEKAQELNELKSRFVTMASHEFRTPLAGVLSSINLAERYLNAEEKSGVHFMHKAKIENHFSKIRESVGNLTQILNEFLSLGKLEEGKVRCQWEEINLIELVENIPEDFQRLCKVDQQIITSVALSKPSYILDLSMIRNILNNLISNAIKYSDKGSKIRVAIKESGKKLSLTVEDEGHGIPKEDQDKLFGRFFRAKNAVNIQGTGLGLNIVKRYVEMMGGSISFTSELNKGTTFTVLIPIRNEV